MHEALKKLKESKTSLPVAAQARMSSVPEERAKRPKFNYHQFPSLFPVEDAVEPEKNTTATVMVGSPQLFLPQSGVLEPPKFPGIAAAPQRIEPSPVGIRKFASFSTFIEGASNRLAVTAAQLAVQFPGKISPIYIFGGTSFGKTHLLEGICSESRRQKNRKSVLFMTAEQFTTSCIEGMKQGMVTFRNRFRDISALLIDDFHFFQKKTATQNELLRTIDVLKSQGVQLIFTGDKPLKELVEIRPELLARLEAGMVCEIQPPEKEMLYTVFQQMIAQRSVPITEEVSRFVVSRLNTHARQLSGALNRLHTTFLTSGKPITIAMAEEVLDDLIRCNRKAVRLPDIEKVVCETFGIGNQSLQSKSRAKQVAYPRMLAMWLARKYTRNALSEIGKYFGDRTHSTVVSAQKKVENWINENAELDCFDQHCSISDVLQKVERLLQAG